MLVEIIGLAGAGKSSLLRALKQNEKLATHADRLSVRNVEALSFYAQTGLQTLPFFFSLYRQGCRLSREEMSRILYVAGMHRYFRQHKHNGKPLLLDQGPIFELATLYAFGPPQLHDSQFQSWWQQHYQLWANSLGLIIWLAAPPEVLLERIRMREQRHAIKTSSAAAAAEFLERYQLAYEKVIKQLTLQENIEIIKFDSSKVTTADIAKQVTLIICGKV